MGIFPGVFSVFKFPGIPGILDSEDIFPIGNRNTAPADAPAIKWSLIIILN